LSLSALVHPDRTHGASEQEKAVANQRFTGLNAAYLRLRELKSRLQVLIELERGTAPSSVQPVGSKYVSLFTQISDLCRKTDTFLAEQTSPAPSLLKVRVIEGNAELTTRLKELQATLDPLNEALDGELKQLNSAWESAPPIGSPGRIDALPCA